MYLSLQIFLRNAYMVQLCLTLALDVVDVKTENWSNVVDFGKNSQT